MQRLKQTCTWGALRVLQAKIKEWDAKIFKRLIVQWQRHTKMSAKEMAEIEREIAARAPTPVRLHVYKISAAGAAGSAFGAYHSGIELHGREYAYGYNDNEDVNTGVWECEPRGAGEGFQYEKEIMMGTVSLTKEEALAIVRSMAREWKAKEYDLVMHNCNHFSDEMAAVLVGAHIPSWVNRLARMGASLGMGKTKITVDAKGSVLEGHASESTEQGAVVIHTKMDSDTNAAENQVKPRRRSFDDSYMDAMLEAYGDPAQPERAHRKKRRASITEGVLLQLQADAALHQIKLGSVQLLSVVWILSLKHAVAEWLINKARVRTPKRLSSPPVLPKLRLGLALGSLPSIAGTPPQNSTGNHSDKSLNDRRRRGSIGLSSRGVRVPIKLVLAMERLAKAVFLASSEVVDLVLVWQGQVAEVKSAQVTARGSRAEALRHKAALRLNASRLFARRAAGIAIESAAEDWRAKKERMLMEQPTQSYCDFIVSHD